MLYDVLTKLVILSMSLPCLADDGALYTKIRRLNCHPPTVWGLVHIRADVVLLPECSYQSTVLFDGSITFDSQEIFGVL